MLLSSTNHIQRFIVIAVAIIVMIIVGRTLRTDRQAEIENQLTISNTLSKGAWIKVSGIRMPDIVAMGFDKTGKYGAIISLEGYLMKSSDGGINWFEIGYVPVEVGEIVNALLVKDNGKTVVGIGVDESAYTAIYEEKANGNWQQSKCVDCGGIFAGSDGMFVGGAGLVVKEESNNWKFSHLPDWASTTLYGVGKNDKDGKLVVVGEANLVAISENKEGWNIASPSKNSSLPFYAADISESITLVGGVNGNLWRLKNNNWQQIKGLSQDLSVLSIVIKDKEVFVSGGELNGKKAFVIYSNDEGQTWERQLVPKDCGKIISIIFSANGMLGATSDGYLLRKTNSNFN